MIDKKSNQMSRKDLVNDARELEQSLVEQYSKEIEDKAKEMYPDIVELKRARDLVAFANTQLRYAIRNALKS